MTREELKQLIDDEITTNGQQLITGEVLNTVLKAIVDNLAKVTGNDGDVLVLGSDGEIVATKVRVINQGHDLSARDIASEGLTVSGDINTDGNINIDNGDIFIGGQGGVSRIYMNNNDGRYYLSIDNGMVRVDPVTE